ncbi:MAG: hypothetical protein ACI85F_001419 [Bacteroidia bacterium]|jgi:hypothetical protein
MKYRLLLLFAAILAFGFQSCTKQQGCTDPSACNYNIDAEENDGSCIEPGTWYPDENGDGRADSYISIKSCDQPDGYVADYFIGSGGGNGGGGGGGALTVEQTQRAVLPYAGATWCPPCGEFGEDTKNHISANFTIDQAIVLSSQQGDAMSPLSTSIGENFGQQFQDEIGSTGIPHMYVCGNTVWEDFYPNESAAESNINSIIAMEPNVGVAVEGTIDADNGVIIITAAAKFFAATSGAHSISILVLEDEVIADQQHSTDGTVYDMVHESIIRASADDANIRGSSIGTSFVEDQIIQKEFSIDFNPGWNVEHLRVIALVWEGNGLQIANGVSADL